VVKGWDRVVSGMGVGVFGAGVKGMVVGLGYPSWD
jgi:hypothetical protein